MCIQNEQTSPELGKKKKKKKPYGVSLVHVVRDEHAVQYAKTCDS